MEMKYFKAEEIGYGTHVYVRLYTAEEANQEFELFKKVHPTPEKGPLVPVHWFEGWRKFRGVPAHHEVLWQEFEPAADFYQCSASHADLITQLLNKMWGHKSGAHDDTVDFEV